MREENIFMLEDTLGILGTGSYEVRGKKVQLKLTYEQMEKAIAYLPREVGKLKGFHSGQPVRNEGRCIYGCENMDSFSLAVRRSQEYAPEIQSGKSRQVLVLNLANSVNPGGGVHKGSKAQEEDLCRKSSLLISLESQYSQPYYTYNKALHTFMGTHGVILHPQVEIIKDDKGHLLEDSVVVSVLSCAAPDLRYGKEGLSQKEYEDMIYQRILGIFRTAAYHGYEYLILGAFGCGAFYNDAQVVSDLFYKALKDFEYEGLKEHDLFTRIDFAVLDHSRSQYNYKQFARNFTDFYREEDRDLEDKANEIRKERGRYLDAIRGCIYGGAVGDALGYPVEFMREKELYAEYGPQGITAFETNYRTGKAMISDDTQMTLFTANGLLVGDTRKALRGTQALPRAYVALAYLDWLKTQNLTMDRVNRYERCTKEGGYSWLLDVRELYSERAPGLTCLSALEKEKKGETFEDYVQAKRNESKGCGGIMRVAPMAVESQMDIETLDMEGAQLAAITHGHSLGYMTAAVLVHILNRIIYPKLDKKVSLKEIILEARDTAMKLFAGDPHLEEMTDIINKAVDLAENSQAEDLDNIHKLGEGWVAEETLGIALYCALRYEDDFSAGVIAAVNHKGDSDSTGAVTGNILGALLGYDQIEDKWKKDLELSDVILEIADDLCYGCQMSQDSNYRDPRWEKKYIHMHKD